MERLERTESDGVEPVNWEGLGEFGGSDIGGGQPDLSSFGVERKDSVVQAH